MMQQVAETEVTQWTCPPGGPGGGGSQPRARGRRERPEEEASEGLGGSWTGRVSGKSATNSKELCCSGESTEAREA